MAVQPISKYSAGSQASASPNLTNGKASAASPKLSEDDNIELDAMLASEPKLPLHDDIMQLARLGEVGPVQKLFETGRVAATYKDEEGITPLHWAAINNHFALCKFLLESGADVNAKGGESIATPAMWAAQRCHYYVVWLLLQNGADTVVTDGQGYNILHLATFDGNVFLLILLLHQDMSVDIPDPSGHTSLMWAAYKGYPACVDLFLRWGASVKATDENGFTPLHWALVKGSAPCVQKLIEYGSDRFAETSTHKSPSLIAEEMKSTRVWHRALDECGYDEDGKLKKVPLPAFSFLKQRSFHNRFFFLYPFFVLYVVFFILSYMVIYAGVPMAAFVAYSLQWLSQKVLIWTPSDMRHIHRTPYLAGVFAATCFWVGFRWLTNILPTTYSTNPISNIFFAISYGLCTYFYMYSVTEDPGYVPKLGSRTQQKTVINELLGLWKFDDQNYCVQCMIRQPLRSKHCKRCGRCVAKHDHHCPWIHNCVGANNHRHFFLYILFLQIGILLYVRLVLSNLENLPPPANSQCNVLAESICGVILRDPFTVVLSTWAGLQLVWVTMLLAVQLVQISRALTTYESMRGSLHGSQASEAITSALTAGSSNLEGAQLTGNGAGQSNAAISGHGHAHKKGYFEQWKQLLGLDTFAATAGGRSQKRRNPFSRGVITNCKDFWFDPAPYFGQRETGAALLGGDAVNYTRMYDPPPRMKLRRPRQGDDGTMYASIDTDEHV